MGIGKAIKALREGAGLTQSQLASEIGVTAAAVGNYELDVSFPRADVLYRIFEVLECEPNTLFEGHFTEKEKEEYAEHLSKYRKLDSHGRELVDACTDIEYRRCTEQNEGGILIAARNGGQPRRIALKKRGNDSIFDKPDYKGGNR